MILRGFALTHSLMECILKPPPSNLNIYTLVFSNYCHQMGTLWLWQHVNVSWIEASWAGGSRWLMWRSLTPAERYSKNSLTTQEKPNLHPEDFFSPSACVDTVQSFLVLLWHSLSFPDDFLLQRAASCVRHTSVCGEPLWSRTRLTSAARLEPGTGETPACTDTFTGDQLPYRFTVSRVPLESSVPSERGQEKHNVAALVWWGQPRTRT